MTDPLASQDTLSTVKSALDGLAKRQELISHNLANVDTPGYQAKHLNFETALRNSLKRSGSIPMSSTREGHLSSRRPDNKHFQVLNRKGGTARADGNNVDIDQELLAMSETNLRFQTLTKLLGKKYSLLREIASRR